MVVDLPEGERPTSDARGPFASSGEAFRNALRELPGRSRGAALRPRSARLALSCSDCRRPDQNRSAFVYGAGCRVPDPRRVERGEFI